MFLKWLAYNLYYSVIIFILHVRSIMLLRPCVAMGVQCASLGITHRCRCSEGTIVYKRCIRRLMFARAHTCIERYTYLQNGWERRSNFSADVRFDVITQVAISECKISISCIHIAIKNKCRWYFFHSVES